MALARELQKQQQKQPEEEQQEEVEEPEEDEHDQFGKLLAEHLDLDIDPQIIE